MEFPFFGDAYRVTEMLTEHSYTQIYGGTYTDAEGGVQDLVFKCLNLGTLPDWGVIQHLEYEADLLQGFDHPRLPSLLERKEVLYEGERYLCLIQQRMRGENLQQWLHKQIQMPLSDVLNVILQSLSILKSLHCAHPALMHLDLKPSNVMLTPEGDISIIDFGAAQTLGQTSLSVIGTPGYTPAEQLAGQAVPASDIYALGATVVELLSGTPAERFYDGHRLDFWPHIDIPPVYKSLLEIMLHPDAAFRFDNAEQALDQWLKILHKENTSLAQSLQQKLKAIPELLHMHGRGLSRLGLEQRERPLPILAGYQFEVCKSSVLQRASETWFATRSADQTPVIIKKITLSALENWNELAQFEREIENLSALQHEAFPQLLGVEKQAEAWYLIQERLPGTSLRETVEQGWRPDTLALCEWILSVLQTLRVLHQQNPPLVHRDLQPDHILMAPDQIYLLGFGGAQQRLMSQGGGGSTQTGSFGYTAPEQYLGMHSAESDLFSLGMCTLYILGQRSPVSYRWENQSLDLGAILLPEGLKGWLKRVTHLDPQQRHSSAEDAYAALKHQYEALKVATQRLSSVEKQQGRLEALRVSEAQYAQQIQRFETQEIPAQWQDNAWIQALKDHQQPLPPTLRIQMEGAPGGDREPGHLMLRIAGPSPSREPRIEKLELASKGLVGLSLVIGLIGVWVRPAFLVPLMASLALLIWVKGPLTRYLCDFLVVLTPETLQWQKVQNTKWKNVSGGRPTATRLITGGQLDICEMKSAFPLQRKYYRLDYPGFVHSPIVFLLDSEKQWLEAVFPWFLSNLKQS